MRAFLTFFIVTFLWASSVFAQEAILSFDSDLVVSPDGVFTVSETIVVKTEQKQIRRGIYRDFPLVFQDEQGKRRKVTFDLVSVKRDGVKEKSRIENIDNGIRIYIGNSNVILPPGRYSYEITYTTARQVRFFERHDEVYWNATGNFWNFPIYKSSAKIVLPPGTNVEETRVFTGAVGSTEAAAQVSTTSGGRVVRYTTTRTLNSGEGLTILAKIPKGVISQPSSNQQYRWFFRDNQNTILATIILLLSSVYYYLAWSSVGRDPQRGAIVPRWDISDDKSPALVNYIYRKGLAGKGFDAISAAVLNLAVKGYVVLDKLGDDLHIKGTGKEGYIDLPVGERAILGKVKANGHQDFVVNEDNGEDVKALQLAFSRSMEDEHRAKFYKHNIPWVITGVLISVLGLAATLFFGNFTEDQVSVLFGVAISTGVLCFFVFTFVKNVGSFKGLAGKVVSMFAAGIIMFGMIAGTVKSIVSGLGVLDSEQWLLTVIVGIIVLNMLFFFLLGAPTPLGRKHMDEIEGLRMYLELAEKDRMNLIGAPDFSTDHYEKLLPYAVALGVEKPWSKALDTWLAAAVATGAVAGAYAPGWYHGTDFGSGSVAGSMEGFSNSMQSGFSNAMPVPKSSSSGFSGGGSGMGGGGGGGGGW